MDHFWKCSPRGSVYQFGMNGGNRKKVCEGSGAFVGITVASHCMRLPSDIPKQVDATLQASSSTDLNLGQTYASYSIAK
jgi:hypothetical protein